MPEFIHGSDQDSTLLETEVREESSDLERPGHNFVALSQTRALLVIPPERMPGSAPRKLKERRCARHFRDVDQRHGLC